MLEKFKKEIPPISKAVKLMVLYSAFLNFGTNSSFAQNTDQEKNFEGVQKIEWNVKASDKFKEKTEKAIREQEKWLINYIKSPKYKERLGKELLVAVNKDTLSLEDWETVDDIIAWRLKQISKGRFVMVKQAGIPGDEAVTGMYMLDNDSISISKNFTNWNGDPLNPLHENTHKVNKYVFESTGTTIKELSSDTAITTEKIEERFPEINQFRFLLKEEGIYDANTEDFTKEHYEKALENKKIINNKSINLLLDEEKEEDIIKLMNVIAGTLTLKIPDNIA